MIMREKVDQKIDSLPCREECAGAGHDKVLIDRLSNIVETAPDAIITADSKGAIVFFNGAALRTFGYSAEELTGMPVTSIMPERFRSTHSMALMKISETETFRVVGRTIELVGQSKDGTEFPIELSLSTWVSDGQRFFTCIIRDITGRKKDEEALLESKKAKEKEHEELNRLFRQVESIKNEWERTMDCVGDMVVLTEGDGRIRRCNRTFKDFTGKTYEEVLGKNWEELLFEHRIAAGTFLREGVEIFHKPTGRWFVVNSYPFRRGKDHEVSGTVITINDSTELKKIAEELEAKNREIEQAYSDLKAAQSQILQQEKMASIGQLAAGVAHEINNPIGFISSNLGTLDKYLLRLSDFISSQSEVVAYLDSDMPAVAGLREKRKLLKLDYILEDVKQLIRESLDGADRVKKIVQDLKSFSRVDETEHKTSDINAGLESTINIVWNELKYKATLKKEFGDIPVTKCNSGQLNQVFMNLLVNSAHAIEKQGEIMVRTWHEGGSIFVSISDTGSGIPADKINRIFEPFFTTKEVGKGTGLGLSIAYEIIQKHNGEISVQSEVGKGTTFTLRIPVVQ